jgi:hypothetical protein
MNDLIRNILLIRCEMSSIDRFPTEREIGDVNEDEHGRIQRHRRGSQSAIHSVVNGISDTENRCAKFDHTSRGVVTSA